MYLAKDYGFKNMEFESDCEAVIKKLKLKSDDDRTYLGSILSEIWMASGWFDTCTYHFIPRIGNQVAHGLAHLAHSKPNNIWTIQK